MIYGPFFRGGGIEIYPLDEDQYAPCRKLMEQYQSLPMDLADATLVIVANTLGISKIFTLDHKDFSVYRFKQKRRFTLIPSKI